MGESFKEEIDNSGVRLEVKKDQEELKEEEYEWKTNELLPMGWKFKEGRGEQMQFLSREGTIVSSNEIQKLYHFDHNTWKPNEYLPQGWMCSSATGSNIRLKSSDGRKFYTYKAAVTFMKNDSNYTSEDMTRLYLYPDGKDRAEKKLAIPKGWKPNEFLPEGWTCKPVVNGTKIRIRVR